MTMLGKQLTIGEAQSKNLAIIPSLGMTRQTQRNAKILESEAVSTAVDTEKLNPENLRQSRFVKNGRSQKQNSRPLSAVLGQ